ncbi:MAG TPA: response regulator [Dongiaceae bacterium]|jgi:CheY-like chemotaxis protein|nr:response regulator [Dongiaceae bacterium]
MTLTSKRLLIVDDNRRFAEELRADAERLGLAVEAIHEPDSFAPILSRWKPDIIAMDLVMPDADGLELLRACARHQFGGHLVLMSGGFELYLDMAQEIATRHGLRVAAKLPKPLRPKQFAYVLTALI